MMPLPAHPAASRAEISALKGQEWGKLRA